MAAPSLVAQDGEGGERDRQLDQGSADGQEPNLALCLGIHNRLTLRDTGGSRLEGPELFLFAQRPVSGHCGRSRRGGRCRAGRLAHALPNGGAVFARTGPALACARRSGSQCGKFGHSANWREVSTRSSPQLRGWELVPPVAEPTRSHRVIIWALCAPPCPRAPRPRRTTSIHDGAAHLPFNLTTSSASSFDLVPPHV